MSPEFPSEVLDRRFEAFVSFIVIDDNDVHVVAFLFVVIPIADDGLKAHSSEAHFRMTSPPSGKEDTDDHIPENMSRLSMMNETVGLKSTTGRSVRLMTEQIFWQRRR